MELTNLDAKPKAAKRRTPYTALTLKYLRAMGYTCVRTEHYDAHANVKHDYLGFIDYHALSDAETLGVQICGKDYTSHIKKMTVKRAIAVKCWLACPGRTLILIGWGKVKGKYEPRITNFWLTDGEIRHD